MKTLKPALILALLMVVLFATGMAYAEFRQGGSPGGGYYGHSGGGYYGHSGGGYYGRHGGGYYGYPGRGYYGGYYRGWGYYPWWRGGIGVYWDPWYYPGPYSYPYNYPYYNPYPVAVPSLPETYIERSQPSEPSAPSGVWYYCPDSKGYYPYVKECPGGWQTLPAQPPADRRR